MADEYNDRHTPERYEDTTNPRNPPQSVADPAVRRAAFWSYVGPLAALFIVIGIALIYWANRGPVDSEGPDQIGTTGEQQDTVGDSGTSGGFDPQSRPDSTADELERRGADGSSQGPMPGLTAGMPLNELGSLFEGESRTVVGRRIDVQDVNVTDAGDGRTFWIQDGNARVAVLAPPDGPAVRSGSTVDVSGVVEPDGQGSVRIRATRVTSD
jgi:hypothetical protein